MIKPVYDITEHGNLVIDWDEKTASPLKRGCEGSRFDCRTSVSKEMMSDHRGPKQWARIAMAKTFGVLNMIIYHRQHNAATWKGFLR